MYVPNNIEFRIISSGAIAKFKQDQAFDFNEIAHSTMYKFTRESKEILLLNYEMWFKFVSKLEKLFIRYHSQNSEFSVLLREHVNVLIDDCISEIDEVMACNPAVFHSDVRHVLSKTNSVFIDFIFHISRQNVGNNIAVAFPLIVRSISDSLHNLLFQLHEIEFLRDNSTGIPFISYSNECKRIITALGVFPVLHRAEIYREAFGQSSFNIKNYSDEPIELECINKLTENGISVNCVEAADDKYQAEK